MAGTIYRKPVLFTIAAAVAVLVGTLVMMAYPMLRADMHPRLERTNPYTPLQLAGRDVYQREGCVNCHTQTVRPLKAEVARYGDYSKAGEFTYDHPFLWGSKRTGPDLARIGGKYPDGWHYKHFENPQAFAAKSNMPRYAFLKDAKLDPAAVEAHMRAVAALHPGEVKWAKADVDALAGKTEMDALVAYMQVLGTAVERKKEKVEIALDAPNPLAGQAGVVAKGRELYDANCANCHGAGAEGELGPSLVDDVFLSGKGDLGDGAYYRVIAQGTEPGPFAEGRNADGGMPPFGGDLSADEIWSVVSFLRDQKAHETSEPPHVEAAEHAGEKAAHGKPPQPGEKPQPKER
jgi:cytochrome c oxidase cbb3-type subunit 2